MYLSSIDRERGAEEWQIRIFEVAGENSHDRDL